MKSNSPSMNGENRRPNRFVDKPTSKSTTIPYGRNRYQAGSHSRGSTRSMSDEPSSGGIGNRLNRPRMRLASAKNSSTWITSGKSATRNASPVYAPKAARAATAATTINAKFDRGPASPTKSISRRGLRSFVGSTGTGFAQPNAPNPLIVSSAGRMIEPNGSMCGIGFSVRRPARLAVSSPKSNATTPWLISCRMIATNRQAKKTRRSSTSALKSRGASSAAAGRAVDAQPGCGHGLEPRLGDLIAARLAPAVRPGVELAERVVDLPQGFEEGAAQRLDLTSLRGDLSRVGKAVVEVELAAGTDAHLAQLVVQAVPLFLQAVAQRRVKRLGHGTEA